MMPNSFFPASTSTGTTGLSGHRAYSLALIVLVVGWLMPELTLQAADRYWVAGSAPLDAVAAIPAAPYSLRKLRAAYIGAAIRVRVSPANTETDIGFAASGDLDISALNAFIGTGSGFVTTWDDQIGNGRDAALSVAGDQPHIVDNRGLEMQDGRPCFRFFGTGSIRVSTAPFTA